MTEVGLLPFETFVAVETAAARDRPADSLPFVL